MLQNATPLRKSAPWPPNISHEHVFCTPPATENASLQILFKCPTPAMVFGNATKPSRFAHFWQGAQSLAPATRHDIWTVLYILTSKCASRHNGVHFFISHLARWLRTRRFSEPTFRPSGATIIGKTQCFATFLPFRASASSFFWLFLFSDLLSSTLLFSLPLPSSAFHLSILSEVWLLNFLRLFLYWKTSCYM